MNKELFKKIYKLIKSYDEIVIARHVGPDPDAVASAIALRDSIRLSFPNKRVYAVGSGVSRFKYLGNHDRVDFNSLTNALLIVLDIPNFARIDGIEGFTYSDILKIDHHPKEDIKGTVDFTSSNYSSTAEMVSELLLNSKLVINKEIAEKLYIGIVSDSERFLFKNTTPYTLEIASTLIKKYKLDITELYENLYFKSITDAKFEAYITNNLTITDNFLGYIVIENDTLEEYKVDSSVPSVIINNYNYIKELLVWCFLTYDMRNEVYKVNLRSRGPVINEIASHYNGGGHKFAAGARIYNKEDISKLIEELDNACKEYKGKQDETN